MSELNLSTHFECALGDAITDGVLAGEVGQHRVQGFVVFQVVDQHVQSSHHAHDVAAEFGRFEVVNVDALEQGLSTGG